MSAGRKNNSEKKDWNTPPKYVNPIREFFGGEIDLDPCSNKFSLVKANVKYIYPENDGLVDSWDGNKIFVNPPYGREKGKSLYDWFDKAVKEFKEGKEIIFLVPVATNTKHFKEIVFNRFSSICFLSDTRLKFYNEGVEDKKGAPMACCLCYLGERVEEFDDFFWKYGKVFRIN
jgi:hypothetical protein